MYCRGGYCCENAGKSAVAGGADPDHGADAARLDCLYCTGIGWWLR
nr:MAG TPA: hypothetical protein [Bacteriophage sp.]